MVSDLITSWGDYQQAIDRLLVVAQHKICIYDGDLAQLALDTPRRHGELRRILQEEHATRIQIILRNSAPLGARNPRLMSLLGHYGHRMSIQETPPELGHLRDAMILVDERSGLIRFERDMPRSKLLTDEAAALKAYSKRFEDLWSAGGSRLMPTTLGL